MRLADVLKGGRVQSECAATRTVEVTAARDISHLQQQSTFNTSSSSSSNTTVTLGLSSFTVRVSSTLGLSSVKARDPSSSGSS